MVFGRSQTQPASEQARRDQQRQRESDISCLFSGILAPLRWVVLAALLLLSIAQPMYGKTGAATWALILGFIGYNAVLELLRQRFPSLQSFARVPLLDLPVTAIIYSLGATPGGPLFMLWLLIVTCAAISLSLRHSLIYTFVATGIMAAIAPTLPLWAVTSGGIREFGTQVITMLLVGLSTVVLARRIVQERLVAQAHQDEAERLAELSQLRNDFIASVSHNLRTPLTAIKSGVGFLDASARDRLEPQEQKLIGTVQRNIERLERHINDLLALNQIEAGVLQLDLEPIDARAVVVDALSSVLLQLREKQQELELDLPESLPILGDSWWLGQVIANILCNAHDHTPAGTRILLSGHVADGNVYLTIADNGPGIAPEAHQAIFEPFHSSSTETKGTGLGLAICKGIVLLHAGQIWVESSPGEGAVFHITLPVYQRENNE